MGRIPTPSGSDSDSFGDFWGCGSDSDSLSRIRSSDPGGSGSGRIRANPGSKQFNQCLIRPEMHKTELFQPNNLLAPFELLFPSLFAFFKAVSRVKRITKFADPLGQFSDPPNPDPCGSGSARFRLRPPDPPDPTPTPEILGFPHHYVSVT